MKPYPTYKDSGVEWIGEVPEGWEIAKLKWVAAFRYGDSLLDEKTAQIDTLIKQKCRLIELLTEERAALISQAVTKGIGPDWSSLQDCSNLSGYKDSGVEESVA